MNGFPWVTVGYAQSIDGRIATIGGESRWISSPGTLRLAQRLRRDHQVIVAGIDTVLRDDPELTCRLPRAANPVRVILDSRLRLPEQSKIGRTARGVPTIVLTRPGRPAERARRLEELGIQVREVDADDAGRIEVRAAMAYLGGRGFRSIFVEGGGRVITSFLRSGLVRRMLIVVAPLLIGEGIPAVGDLGVRALAEAIRPPRFRTRRLGPDLVWELFL